MAHIKQIIIKGLLGREKDINFQLKRGVNIFFGENGCGKTTLLKVLDAALSRNGPAMERLPVSKAHIDIFSVKANRLIRHTWQRRNLEHTNPTGQCTDEFLEPDDIEITNTDPSNIFSSQDHEWKLTPPELAESIPSAWAHAFLPTTRIHIGYQWPNKSATHRALIPERQFDQSFSDSVNRAWLQFYSKTLKEVSNIQESGFRAVLRHVLNPTEATVQTASVGAEAVYARVASFLARQSKSEKINLGSPISFKRRYEADANLRKMMDNLEEIERSIEQAMGKVSRFLETISMLFSRGKKLQLSENELQVLLTDGRALPISELSSGEKHLIKILLTSMTAGPNSVLIDEPELSMHIDWQRSFVSTIHSVNPGCQLILATHSPEIMAEVPDSNIFKL